MNFLYHYCGDKLCQIDEFLEKQQFSNRIIMSETYEYKVCIKNNKLVKVFIDEKEVDIKNIPSEIRDVWFVIDEDDYLISYNLLNKLSELSKDRKRYHQPKWFVNKKISVKFKTPKNGQFIPYTYSNKK